MNAILEKKGRDIVVLSVREMSSFTDYFVVCTGTSVRHTQAISTIVQETMKKEGYPRRGVEGETTGTWILLDYHDLIVHIFYEPVRQFYAIENLWADAPVSRIDENAVTVTTLTG